MDQYIYQILKNQLEMMRFMCEPVESQDIHNLTACRYKTANIIRSYKPAGGYWVEKPGGPSVVQSMD